MSSIEGLVDEYGPKGEWKEHGLSPTKRSYFPPRLRGRAGWG